MTAEELMLQVKEILKHPCACGNEHLRCELATDEKSCRVWCEICGWDIIVQDNSVLITDRTPPEAMVSNAYIAEYIVTWISSRRGTNWEIDKLVSELRGMIK